MKFIISKKIIDQSIDFLSLFNDSNDVYVPFRGILFKINSENLTLISAKNNLAARKIIRIDEKNLTVEEPGIFLLNSSLLKNIIKKFDDKITFQSIGQNIKIFDKNTKYTLTTLDADRYPFINFDLQKNKFTVNSRKFENTINNVFISTNQNTERNNGLLYKCINIKSNKNKEIRMTATDSFRLSSEVFKINEEINLDVSVEAKNLKKLFMKDMPEEVTFFYDEEKIGVLYKDIVIHSNLSKLTYLNIDNFIKPIYSKSLVINRDEFLKLINKVVFYNSDKIRRLQFNISKEELKLSFEVPEIGISNASTSNIMYNGEILDIDLDFQFIKDAVSVFPNGNIHLNISESNDRIYVLANNNESHIQLITPIRRY
ncbi:DNA polymerase-3 subunit beta [Mycoplasmopsis mustelae]|uniref:DNA polymerase-3 subunit beta n=1 Tax=Mycoplasmopsis mustelae TaxID=171289 RepID=A0A4R7UE97_9BACT|nr:DNA polymerase III subunit beta [Mycoplasmopsis mustelae]TDV24396.1 DNA polymerase-3 subunit beta [Mycoplasmopsis mustelae]